MISGISNASYLHLMAKAIDQLTLRICNAAVRVFTWIKTLFSRRPPSPWPNAARSYPSVIIPAQRPFDTPQSKVRPVLPAQETLQNKLAAYRDLPKTNTEFLKKAIEIFETVLARKDQKIEAAMRAEHGEAWESLGLPKPDHWGTFTSQAADLEGECFPPILMAAVRAYTVSPPNPDSITFFNTHKSKIRVLNANFNQLSDPQKEIVLDEFEDLDAVLTGEAKNILREIAKISNALLQGNPDFNQAVQAAILGRH